MLALGGTATAVVGVILGEFKPFVAGLVLILGGMVFARLYAGTRRVNGRSDVPLAATYLNRQAPPAE